MLRSKRSDFLNTLLEAQKLAFAPFIFKAVAAALKTGLLETLVKSDKPLGKETLAQKTALSAYAVGVLVDLLVPAGVLSKNDNGIEATTLGSLIVLDEMTRANFEFSDEVNYLGLHHTLDSLIKGRPAGLKAFDPAWKTIYPHLPDLPDEAKNAWFKFDHFHSDQAYGAALEILSREHPQHLVDIGGNTGIFTRRFLETFETARATLVDLPAETNLVASRPELSHLLDRIDTIAIDWLTQEALTGTEDADLYWMSQFLDCFSFEEAISILKRTASAMNDKARLAVLEPIVDTQRHRAAELSLAATNLYFSVLANGNSRFFNDDTIRALFEAAGFCIESEHPDLGISHTLFILKKRL